ncbi:MAG: glycerol-3-phosphate 1-O-acyltransferase PlsY [Verrucomicrobiota bacterium]
MTKYFLIALGVSLVGYFVGSLPTGHLVGRSLGVDISKYGSGNIGATNVLRVLGRRWGYLVFSIDTLKGFLAVRVAFYLVQIAKMGVERIELLGILAAITCIMGHTFPIWLRFKGGKGVATSAGALLGLMPLAIVAIFCVWLIIFQLTRYVSLASMGAAAALPVVVGILILRKFVTDDALLYFSVLIAGVVIWRHRSNLKRLINGTEHRFSR